MKTRKQLLQELNEQMPDNLSNLEKAAFIANFVANQTAFDEHFWWGNTAERKKVYKLAKQEALMATKDTAVHRKIICVTETSLFSYLARNNGLEIGYLIEGDENTIYESKSIYKLLISPQHISAAVKDEQDRWILVDVQKDLVNWNTGCRPEFFGTKEIENEVLSELNDTEIDAILEKIGYAKEGKKTYTDYVISNCIQENSNKTIEEQFKMILEDERILKFYKNLGAVEAYNFTKRLSTKILKLNNEKASKKMNLFVCFRKKSEDEREYNFGVFSDSKESQWIYMFSKKQKTMVKVSKKEMKYMLSKGIILRGKQFNQGRLEKFIKDVNYDNIEENPNEKLNDEFMYEDEEK